MKKTAIIGASGYIGSFLFDEYRRFDADAFGTAFSHPVEPLIPFDLRRPNLSSFRLRERGFQAILIASAVPNVAYCEQNREESQAVNVIGTLETIRQAIDLKIQPMFLSSDYVFDGKTGSYDDDARTNPSTEYGRQKQFVEQELPRLTDDYLILRLSKIYGVKKGDGTLLDEIAIALKSGMKPRVAYDQLFSPTYVEDVVKAVVAIQQRNLTGLFNICASQHWSRFQLALRLAEEMGFDEQSIERISLHDIPAMAGRPLNTSMIASRMAREVGFQFVPMEDSIRRVAAHSK